jgi:hypothetical protein
VIQKITHVSHNVSHNVCLCTPSAGFTNRLCAQREGRGRVRPSVCIFISETTELILTKFVSEGLHCNLCGEFYFGQYLLNMTHSYFPHTTLKINIDFLRNH